MTGTRITYRKLAFLARIVIFFLASPLYANDLRQPLNILAIHSYHQDYSWTESQHDAYKKHLVEILPKFAVNFSTEYLNTKRINPSAEYKRIFFEYLNEKYKNNRPDLIYVTDDNALSFILSSNQETAWQVPIVFSGINNTNINLHAHNHIVAGIFEVKDIHASIGLANHIAGKGDSIIFTGDGGTTDIAIKNTISSETYKNNNLEIIHLSDTVLDTLIDKINNAGKGIVILTTIGRVHDSQGDLLGLKEIIQAITNTGRKVLVMEDSYLFLGVLGGYVTSSRIQGESAARISERIVREQSADNLNMNTSELILSWPDANRFNIDIDREAFSKATLINLPVPILEKYPELIKWLLWFVLVLFLVLIAFILNARHKSRLLREQYADSVTGLPNRVKLLRDIDRSSHPCLCVIDINNFKSINNHYGLGVGDHLLGLLAEKLRKSVSGDNRLYRIGGNQFAILNRNYNNSPRYCLDIKSLLNKIQNNSYEVDGLGINLTLTAGIIIGNSEHEFLIPRAEQALQQAKDNNKDYVILEKHNQDIDLYNKNILWAQKLNKALNDSRIIPYYQVIVDNKTGEKSKYEALARLIDEDNKVVTPFFFLDAAKTTRQYAALTKTMIDKTLETLQKSPHSVSLNFSVDDIRDGSTIAFFKLKLIEHQVADRVIVELTESEGIENYLEVSEFISDIKQLGCRVAIDDFGTGYSNFTHLIHLNVDYLKIDGSIIQNILRDKNAEIVATTLVQFARQLGIETVAEFVDSEEIHNKVKDLGIDYSQGYFLGKPGKELLNQTA